MRSIGSALLFFGGGSTVMYFLNYEFLILSWIDNWGETVGWVIRGAMIVVGGGLMLFDMFANNDSEEEEEAPEEQQA